MLTYEELLAENAALKNENIELKTLNEWYREQLKLSKKRLFGASSKKTDFEQINLFNEAESEREPLAKEPELEEITYKLKKQKGHREKLLKNLEVETIEYRTEQACPQCGEPLHEMSKEVRRELEIIPAKVKVVEHVSYIYSCRKCEKEGIATPIIKAESPEALIPKSLVSPSLMSYIIHQKFVNAQPLYRQEQDFKRMGLLLSRKTLSNWMIRGAQILEPIYSALKRELLSKEILHADETTLEVLCEPGRPAQAKSYMWLYCTGKHDVPITLYEYTQGRGGVFPEKFLGGFDGYLHVDGYSGYERLEPEVKLCGCWAHLRRKFDEAIVGLPNKNPEHPAVKGLAICNELFKIEREIGDKPPEEIYAERQRRSKPVAEAFFAWAGEMISQVKVVPQGLTGKALDYALKQKSKLLRFLEDGRLEMSNNRAERAVKPFVIGRKNWLFCNTQGGANSSAIIYSIVETAKLNGLKPMEYLVFLFDKLKNGLPDDDTLQSIMPWNNTIPGN